MIVKRFFLLRFDDFKKLEYMKKLLLFIVLSIITVNATNAQDFRFGAKAGLNLSTFTGDAFTGFDTRASFHIGALVELPLSEKFSIQPELLYSEKGSDLDDFFLFQFKANLNYIDIPVMAKYYVIEGLSIELGPVASILVKAEGSDKGVVKDVSDLYKTFDFGIGIGASYRLPMDVFFSLRFVKGVLDANERDSLDDYSSDFKVQNNVFQISAGYSF